MNLCMFLKEVVLLKMKMENIDLMWVIFFIFPLGVYHEQRNTGDDVFEAVFIRTK